MENWKDNVSFVLVKPKEPGNIGASARAMKNMGFHRLELLNPPVLADEARWMACNAVDMIEKAAVHSAFKDTIKDKSLIVGTTKRLGRRRGLILPLNEGIKKIHAVSKKNRVAILFGREDKGLKNREVEECDFLMTIPTDRRSPSLNLAQSVLLVAYELGRKTYKKMSPKVVERNELDVLYRHICSALEVLDYNEALATKIMKGLKHLIGRAGLTEWELRMLHGLCSQIEKKDGMTL